MMTTNRVIRVDGGICSQLYSIATGMMIKEESSNEVDIAYDLSWFKENGVDCNGVFVRNWDIPKAFPDLDVCEAKPGSFKDYTNPRPEALAYMARHSDKFKRFFSPEIDDKRRAVLDGMMSCDKRTCAVHVRRGDLASYSRVYGQPTSLKYYLKAVWLIRQVSPNTKFYFFSDEPNWVRDELLPLFPDMDSVIVSGENESDKGYMDLFLISKADYIIASIGSLGIMGAILSDSCKMLVMSRKLDYLLDNYPNAIYIDCSPESKPLKVVKRTKGLKKIVYKLWKRLGKMLDEQ